MAMPDKPGRQIADYFGSRKMSITNKTTNRMVYMSLLYFASQLGKKISKLSFGESEYFRAIRVIGQDLLKMSSTMPSDSTTPMEIQTHLSILPERTA